MVTRKYSTSRFIKQIAMQRLMLAGIILLTTIALLSPGCSAR